MTTTPTTPRLGALVACAFLWIVGQPQAHARDLTLDERVAAREAIERVYWSHRIWPAENPGPKPAFSAVMTDAAIRAKVDDELRNSALLDAFWHQAPTGEQLQAEINRMAEHTKAPGTLREAFAALRDDPLLIAECLARPALTQRRVAAAYANDPRLQGAQREARAYQDWAREAAPTVLDARAIAPPEHGYAVPSLPDGASCANDNWQLSTLTNASGTNVPAARQLHSTIWTGSEMIVWGGWDGANGAFATGGLYDPATDTWSLSLLTSGSGVNVPTARYRHTAIWTGSEMIVWGGRSAAGTALNNGGRYNPATDLWALSTLTNGSGVNVPAARQFHTAIWTGSQMIVWGGTPDTPANALKTGGVYDPGSDTWSLSTLTNGSGSYTPVARTDHTAVWTGSKMIVWGGRNTSGSSLNTGGVYDPASDTWSLSLLTDATGVYTPTPRYFHSAVWTGSEMIVWGGTSGSLPTNTGGRYNPSSDAWALTSLTNATGVYVPTPRQLHTAVWSGAEMIVWGGSTDGSSAVLHSGGRYTPLTDSWALSTLTNATGANVPSARQYHTAVWTSASDQRMIVWGGSPTTATGGLFCAVCALHTWYQDADADTYGDSAATLSACTQPPGYVATGGDCNDANAAIHPGALETCNGIDDNCDTLVDNGPMCSDGFACTADVCSAGACLATHVTVNLDATGFSASRVDGRDLIVLANAWNSCPGDLKYAAAANLDQGAAPPASCIDDTDFHLFMISFGQSCP